MCFCAVSTHDSETFIFSKFCNNKNSIQLRTSLEMRVTTVFTPRLPPELSSPGSFPCRRGCRCSRAPPAAPSLQRLSCRTSSQQKIRIAIHKPGGLYKENYLWEVGQDYLHVRIRFLFSLFGRSKPYFSLNSVLPIWKAAVSSGKATLKLPGIFPSSCSSFGFRTSTKRALPSPSLAVSWSKVTIPMAAVSSWLQDIWKETGGSGASYSGPQSLGQSQDFDVNIFSKWWKQNIKRQDETSSLLLTDKLGTIDTDDRSIFFDGK